MEPDPSEDTRGVVDDPDPDGDVELDAREAARMKRRDHDAAAHARELMRPGMGKVFKQILDRYVRDADERPAKKRGHHR